MSVDEIDLSYATRTYAVANTPHFLLGKLRQNLVVRDLARSLSGEELFNALRDALPRPPQNLTDRVRPYVFLVALSLKSDAGYLEKTRALEPGYPDDWFNYARRVLIETYRPTGMASIAAARQVQPPFYNTVSHAVTIKNVA